MADTALAEKLLLRLDPRRTESFLAYTRQFYLPALVAINKLLAAGHTVPEGADWTLEADDVTVEETWEVYRALTDAGADVRQRADFTPFWGRDERDRAAEDYNEVIVVLLRNPPTKSRDDTAALKARVAELEAALKRIGAEAEEAVGWSSASLS